MAKLVIHLEDFETPIEEIEEICVTDEEKQALILLDDFINQYRKDKKLPKDVEIKEVERSMDALFRIIKREKPNHTNERNKHLAGIAERAAFTLGILAMEKVSALRYFQNALCYYLAMKKRLGIKTPNNLSSGKIEAIIADDLAICDLPSINRIYQMMQEAHEMAIKEGNEKMATKIKDTLFYVSKERENEGISLNEWEDRFLDHVVKTLRACGLGKVYKEGAAIFIQLGDAAYKPTAFHDSDSPVVDGRVTKDEYLRTIVESVTYNAMFEITQPPSELKISAQITSLSEHLKKLEFIPS